MAVRALLSFPSVSLPRDLPFYFFYFLFLFSFFLFSFFDEHRPPTDRNGDTASPRLCLFHLVLVGAAPGAAARLSASMAGRAGVWQRARQMQRDALATLFRRPSFDHARFLHLFFFLFVRALCVAPTNQTD